jgi:hypothetical protein
VTVRQRIDQLAAEPPVSDLGYMADQRLVATALLGLQLLADEIDALKAAPDDTEIETRHTGVERDPDDAGLADIVPHLAELTAQVKKLTKAVKENTRKHKKKPKK